MLQSIRANRSACCSSADNGYTTVRQQNFGHETGSLLPIIPKQVKHGKDKKKNWKRRKKCIDDDNVANSSYGESKHI
jgi:hypothetical protein